MIGLPKITSITVEKSLSVVALRLGEHDYALSGITFYRNASLLEKKLTHQFAGQDLWQFISITLPYEANKIVIRRKEKLDGKPFVLRTRSHFKECRMGYLVLPFHDFKFKTTQRLEYVGYEQFTHIFFQSTVEPKFKIPIKTSKVEVPSMVAAAQDALMLYLREERKLSAARNAYEEAQKKYIELDPNRNFLRRHREVTEALTGTNN
jgi:hypothetical protein